MASSIEWTDVTWNPVVGCRRVSPGCEHCYAEKVAHRGLTPSHKGLTVLGKQGVRWTGEVRFLPERLDEPLRWRKPRRVFVNSMSDLFHEGVSFEQISAVFGVMAACPQHTFQVLTKRPERMLEFFRWIGGGSCPDSDATCSAARLLTDDGYARLMGAMDRLPIPSRWPLPNVWIGVSVEDQRRAEERIPLLIQCPAALRFLSVEPMLEKIDLRIAAFNGADSFTSMEGLGWVIVGGESGPGARPFHDEWARSIIGQCRAAGAPCFVKQMGAAPMFRACGCIGGRCKGGHLCNGIPQPYRLADRKGGDMSEWPEDLRVREMPEAGCSPCA